MSRFSLIYLLFASLVFSPVLLSCQGKKDVEKPNVIYILADDLGYGDLSCYGQKKIKTPNVDKLAAEGMKFTKHHSGSTVCAPSRSCLLTGQHTGHTEVRGNGQFQLSEGTVTVGHIMQKAGYHTAMIGKAGTGCNCEVGQVNKMGFDYFYGFLSHKAAHSYFPDKVYRNSEEVVFPNNGGLKTYAGDTYIHDEFLKEVKKYITDHKDEPFFLNYSALLPHAQLYAPEKSKEPYKGMFKEVPYTGKSYSHCEDPKTTFAGMVNRLDWEVGEIMQHLKDLGLDENTLVIFASDNGPHSAGGHDHKRFDSNGDLRGQKRDLYEGGVNVPMIVRWPGKVKNGTTSDHVSAFWDFLPTMCDLIKVDAPKNTDGISFLPTILGKKDEQKQHEYLYWEFYEKGGKVAVLKDGWKAVKLKAKLEDLPLELYNLNKDPEEKNNVAEKYPEKVKELATIMKEAHTKSPYKQFRLFHEKKASKQK